MKTSFFLPFGAVLFCFVELMLPYINRNVKRIYKINEIFFLSILQYTTQEIDAPAKKCVSCTTIHFSVCCTTIKKAVCCTTICGNQFLKWHRVWRIPYPPNFRRLYIINAGEFRRLIQGRVCVEWYLSQYILILVRYLLQYLYIIVRYIYKYLNIYIVVQDTENQNQPKARVLYYN